LLMPNKLWGKSTAIHNTSHWSMARTNMGVALQVRPPQRACGGPVCVARCVWPGVCGPVCVARCVWGDREQNKTT
jgi:hypothetical protein